MTSQAINNSVVSAQREVGMDATTGAGRYAPSPSGALHLGNLRTAVVAWLMARSTGRRFGLRIDDLDPERSRREAAHGQIADLTALGLDFDPPVVWQSDQGAAHRAALARLDTYECFCTRAEIAGSVRAPHHRPDAYEDPCARLDARGRAARRRVRPAALRVRAGGPTVRIDDRWAGSVQTVVDDFVVQRNDGVVAYHLAVVVDDAALGVDQVVRGADLLDSTPRQAWLAEHLGHRVPEYAHVALVTSGSGRRLAKRDRAVTLAEMAAAGRGADQVRDLIAVSLALTEVGEPSSPELMLARFDPIQPPTPWRYG